MAKLAKLRRRHAKGNPEATANPPLATDLVGYIVPGFAAFAATRFLTRVASVQIAKRWPRYAKHAGAVASIGSFAASWFGAHRVQALAKYHDAIVVGTGIATLQSLIQIYLPALGWVVSDATSEVAAAPTNAVESGSRPPQLRTNRVPPVPDGFAETDANTWFSYNDSFEAGSRGNQQKAPPRSPMTSLDPDDDEVDDTLDE